jgi:hypothetical protein
VDLHVLSNKIRSDDINCEMRWWGRRAPVAATVSPPRPLRSELAPSPGMVAEGPRLLS